MGRKKDICAKRKQRVTLRTLPSPGELFLFWQKSDRELLGIILSFSPFPCGLTDHKFTTIGSILIPLSVGTQGWLKINNLSFASCSLIFAGSFFLSVLWCCCRYCCAALFGGDFLPLPLSFSYPLFSGEEGTLPWVQPVIRHRAALSVSFCKQLLMPLLALWFFMAKWLLEELLD